MSGVVSLVPAITDVTLLYRQRASNGDRHDRCCRRPYWPLHQRTRAAGRVNDPSGARRAPLSLCRCADSQMGIGFSPTVTYWLPPLVCVAACKVCIALILRVFRAIAVGHRALLIFPLAAMLTYCQIIRKLDLRTFLTVTAVMSLMKFRQKKHISGSLN